METHALYTLKWHINGDILHNIQRDTYIASHCTYSLIRCDTIYAVHICCSLHRDERLMRSLVTTLIRKSEKTYDDINTQIREDLYVVH